MSINDLCRCPNDWGRLETLDLSVGYQAMYGTIMGPLTAENSPYVVRGDIWVNDQDSLFIEPGVEIIMSANSYFYVRGKLHAVNGTRFYYLSRFK